MTDKLSLVAIFAHPDDEAFGTGGTLARYAAEGVDVHLVTATRGEAGQIANPNIVPDRPMGDLREAELRNACRYFGVKELHLLGYIDGQTTIAPQQEAVYKIVRLLRQIRPQVVISFGPDGIYGHYDHLAVHRWACAAVQLAADEERWPEAGLPYRVPKFYYRAMFAEQVALVERVNGHSYVLMEGIPFPFVGYAPEQITTVIDVRQYVQAKLNGIRCHASQLNPMHPYLQDEFDPLMEEWFFREAYILAQNNLDGYSLPPGEKETDLFAGIR
ncbi:MAG: hypothetical protein D6784_04070 [Chloroflexi bacterium]|nr:MAG: hypothetical protein D6784_04070 [Chloroflexota bacterium]